jgi:hypothetical protein
MMNGAQQCSILQRSSILGIGVWAMNHQLRTINMTLVAHLNPKILLGLLFPFDHPEEGFRNLRDLQPDAMSFVVLGR